MRAVSITALLLLCLLTLISDAKADKRIRRKNAEDADKEDEPQQQHQHDHGTMFSRRRALKGGGKGPFVSVNRDNRQGGKGGKGGKGNNRGRGAMKGAFQNGRVSPRGGVLDGSQRTNGVGLLLCPGAVLGTGPGTLVGLPDGRQGIVGPDGVVRPLSPNPPGAVIARRQRGGKGGGKGRRLEEESSELVELVYEEEYNIRRGVSGLVNLGSRGRGTTNNGFGSQQQQQQQQLLLQQQQQQQQQNNNAGQRDGNDATNLNCFDGTFPNLGRIPNPARRRRPRLPPVLLPTPPTPRPTSRPTRQPTLPPTPRPTQTPTREPTEEPTDDTEVPTIEGTGVPSLTPTGRPSSMPTLSQAPTLSTRPSLAPTLSSQPTLSLSPTTRGTTTQSLAPTAAGGGLTVFGRLEYGFFDGITVTELTDAELAAIVSQTESFYTDLLNAEYTDGTFDSVTIVTTSVVVDEAGDPYTITIDFDSTFVFEDGSYPGATEILSVMTDADYQDYITSYLWLETETILFDVNAVNFSGALTSFT